MFRRSGAIIAIITLIVIVMATVTVVAQTGPSSEPADDTAAIPTVTQSPEAPSTRVREADAADNSEPTPESTPVPADSTPPPTSTPGDSSQDDAAPFLAVTPFTPQAPESTAVPQRRVEAPLQLVIPAIGVDTRIEWVGVDEDGNMDVPSTYRTVAWYQEGPRPGMTGNAVIAGHLDSQTGPAVFYRLSDLQPGDEIIVIAHDGEELRFVVDGIERFDSSTAPVYDIFGPSSGQHLNLITCEGTFDRAAGQYDERLVVYSTLATS